jgi:uncharacterized cupredoxin-like copper-binding protein
MIDMKTTIYVSLALAAAMASASAVERRTLGERTTDSLSKVGEGIKDTGRTIANTTKKAGESVVDAVTPDRDARRVDVNLTENRIEMPRTISSGKTAFVVRNEGREKHNFEIEGQDIDKKFMTSLGPDESRVLHADLAPGNYKVICPVKNHEDEGMRLNLRVK